MPRQIQMLDQAPAADDIEHLMTATDGEHRLAELENRAHSCVLDDVMGDVDTVEMVGFGGSSVSGRVDITSTVKDDGITAVDEITDVIDEIDDRRQDQRHCARSNECGLVSIAGAEPGGSQTLGLGDLAADDEDDG